MLCHVVSEPISTLLILQPLQVAFGWILLFQFILLQRLIIYTILCFDGYKVYFFYAMYLQTCQRDRSGASWYDRLVRQVFAS